jgi:hypothetical protein
MRLMPQESPAPADFGDHEHEEDQRLACQDLEQRRDADECRRSGRDQQSQRHPGIDVAHHAAKVSLKPTKGLGGAPDSY